MKTNKLFIAIGLTCIALGCSNESTETQTVEKEIEVVTENGETKALIAEDISAEDFKSHISDDVIILDVRTPLECERGMIEGAINIDFNGGNFESEIAALDKEKTVLVYCAAGGRSTRAKNILHEHEFKAVYNLIGGYGNWPYKH